MHPFHVQRIQALQTVGYAKYIAFAQWYFGKCTTYLLFPAKVYFSDELSSKKEGIFNTHNSRMRAEENSHVIRCRAAWTQFSFNVWNEIIGYELIEPYLLTFRYPTGRNYLFFLQQVLPQLWGKEQLSASTQKTMLFQHDGISAH